MRRDYDLNMRVRKAKEFSMEVAKAKIKDKTLKMTALIVTVVDLFLSLII